MNTTDNGREPSPEPESEGSQSRFGASMADAARRAGFEPVARGNAATSRALLTAMGGARGLIETIVPGLLFLVIYTVTASLPLSLAVSAGIAIAFAAWRIIAKTPVTLALAGLIGVGASAVLALLTNRPEDNFVLGLLTNSVYGVVLLVSVCIGWPLIGLAVGYLMGDGTTWRRNRAKFFAMQIVTLCWVGLFALRLAVQLPLYFTGNITWLATMKLLMGLPLYAPLLLLSWLIVRSVYRTSDGSAKKTHVG
jgi:hypothetical protein